MFLNLCKALINSGGFPIVSICCANAFNKLNESSKQNITENDLTSLLSTSKFKDPGDSRYINLVFFVRNFSIFLLQGKKNELIDTVNNWWLEDNYFIGLEKCMNKVNSFF